MLLLKFVFCLYMAYLSEGLRRDCQDCLSLSSCSNLRKPVDYRNTNVVTKIRNALCGFDNERRPKVCCSDFKVNTNLLPDSCGDINGDRIVGGTVANIYEFPWMALISSRTNSGLKFKCAGSIINSRYILTAAHCVLYQDIAGVRVGEYDIRYKQDCQGQYPQFVCESHIQDEAVEEKIVHEKFDFSGGYDIALLRLKRPIDFSYKNVQPICLPVSRILRNEEVNGKFAVVAGWGLTEYKKESSVLLKVNITVHTGDKCRSRSDAATEFCAGDLNKDSCDGDSGGPLMVEGDYRGVQRNIQYGIVSRGENVCGAVDTPGVYTDVRKYIDWILDNIKP